MPKKTQLFTLRPWKGGVNTALDPAVIPSNQLTIAENIILGIRDSKEKRPGINKNYDDQTSGSNRIVGGIDFWYLDQGTKFQTYVTVDSDAGFKSVNPSSGTTTALTVEGTDVSAPTIASTQVLANRALIAMDGSDNRIKKYDGTTSEVEDLLNLHEHTSVSRASTGNTRTLVLDNTFKGQNGDTIVITDGPADYNGTYEVTSVSTTTNPNDTITYNADTNLEEGTTADTSMTVNGLAPNGSILQVHQGRLITNDKERPYRLHYSETANIELWGGYGDSGAIDIAPNDNDPSGITAIFPTFQGDLYVAKKTKLYRITGLFPDYRVDLVSDGIGCISHEAVTAVDQTDVVFVSEKGVHSLLTTDKFGDVEETFLSTDIQKTFNDDWTRSRKPYIKVRYLNTDNLVAFAVNEDNAGQGNNNLWLYSTKPGLQGWFNWPDVSCESIFVSNDVDRKRWMLGSTTGRLYQTFTSNRFDIDETGANTAITMTVQTGIIAVDNEFYIRKGFKKVALYYTPMANQTITGTVTVDSFTPQTITFTEAAGVPLGTMVLGQDELGAEGLFGPYSRLVDGYGRGIQVKLVENGLVSQYSIEGLGIEYQTSGTPQEVLAGS